MINNLVNIQWKLVKRAGEDFPNNLDCFQRVENAAMRIWMNGQYTYMEGVQINDVMNGFGVGEVIESRSKKLQKGDTVTGMLKWQSYSILNEKEVTKVQNVNKPQHYISALGISGLTAWVGLFQIAKLTNKDTVVVSAASGAVGQYVVQFARLIGCKVVALVTTNHKKEYLKKLFNFDYVISYQEITNIDSDKNSFNKNMIKRLKQLCAQGVDVYFDNVGGSLMDCVLTIANKNFRVALCGAISGYNGKVQPISRYDTLIFKRGTIQGFIFLDYFQHFAAARKQISEWIDNQQLFIEEDLIYGVENVPKGLQKLLLGLNRGKVIISLAQSQPLL